MAKATKAKSLKEAAARTEEPVVEEVSQDTSASEDLPDPPYYVSEILNKAISLIQKIQHSGPNRRCPLCMARGIHRKGCELGEFLLSVQAQ